MYCVSYILGSKVVYNYCFIFYFILQCSFLPRFSIHIETVYQNNNGSADNVSYKTVLFI